MTNSLPLNRLFSDLEIFSSPELAVMDLLKRRSGISNDIVLTAAGLSVWAHRNGHPCVHLGDICGLIASESSAEALKIVRDSLPPATQFMDALKASSEVVRSIDKGSVGTYLDATADLRPLVLVGDLLFTQRQFADELSIAEQLSERASRKSGMSIDIGLIDRLVPKPDNDDEDAIKVGDTGIANRAAQSVVSNCLTVLTGGPGTGKTFTLTRCLAVLLSTRETELDELSIALIAPTGKAAARAKEIINSFVKDERNSEKPSIGVSEKILIALSRIEPRTIQRALGNKRRMHTRFQHDHQISLPHDIVIVDEMSMVPSYLMARLLEAIRPDSTILLVGDQAQLESVESGSVLRDIVQASSDVKRSLNDRVFELSRVWRQSSDTRIGDLARHIRAGEADKALALAVTNPAGIKFVESRKQGEVPEEVLDGTIKSLRLASEHAMKISQQDHQIAHGLITNNKVLCGPRKGPLGVNSWNALIGKAVNGSSDGDLFNLGTPLLVTVNSPRSKLVNGDIGVVVNYQESDGAIRRRVFFFTEDGGRYLTPAELPQVEICFAMTVHKSQGSEYENLLVILPGESSPLLTRELVYTAVTRAKKSLVISGTGLAVLQAVNNQSVRYSGLKTLMSEYLG
jgi:exodeoxyribonuclease V alpha subunit